MQQLYQATGIESIQQHLSWSVHRKHAAITGGVMQSLCFVATGSRNSRYLMFLKLAAYTDIFKAHHTAATWPNERNAVVVVTDRTQLVLHLVLSDWLMLHNKSSA